MYAIIETCGKQFRVQEGNKIVIDRLAAEIGNEVTFDHVVMLGGDNAKFGAPYIDGAKVTAKVIEHGRGEKVIVFKNIAVNPTARPKVTVRITLPSPLRALTRKNKRS